MTTRFTGVIPALALLAVGTAFAPIAAHAQVQNQTGSMAYPQSNASGQVRIPAPTARDTGNMAYPTSPGGVTEPAPMGADTGNMATPSGRGSLTGRRAAAMSAPMRGDPANSMRPDVAPTPAQTATARALDSAPSAAPVPYTDFMPAEHAATGKGHMMPMHRHAPMHHTVLRHATKPMTGATTPAAAAAPAAGAAAAPSTAK